MGAKVSEVGYRDSSIFEALAFPRLRGGMVDFEDAQAVAQCAAIRICVQPRAEHDNLTHPPLHGGRQGILREARPHGDEDSHPSSGGVLSSLASHGLGVFAQDAQGKGIGEDAALFQDLMSGAVSGCGASRPAWLPQLHE